nr:E-beta-farnesene synthase [Tanacetum cinerariifolium]
YLKFSAKGTKREVFGMPIPGNLITADTQGEPYYKEYLEKVSKHQRYLAGEKGSDSDSPALKPAKATKKSKSSVPKADLRPPVTKPDSSQQPEPKPAPAKKKKATLIVIPRKRFTKMIIHYLQSKHKFHPRPDSLLHLPNKEPVFGYLKFSAKGTKREVFGMPIPGNLITAYIQGEPYYQEYLEKVAKHQRYLAGETRSDPDSLVPKPAKATKKSKSSAPKADLRPPATKLASSQQPEPKPAPAKSKGKKHKSVDEGIPEKEPRFNDEEADVQRALEESLKSIYDASRGPLPPVVIREPESGKYQPLPETPKKKSPADQFIFQMRSSTPTESSSHDESSSLYAKLGLTDSEVKYDKDVPGIDAGVPNEGQARPNLGEQDEGQAGPNPGEQDEGHAGPNPGDAVASQPLASLLIRARPNLKHMDLEATDVSTQPHTEQMDEGFTTTAYPKV